MKIKILVLVALAGAVSGCNETHQGMNRLEPVSYTTDGQVPDFGERAAMQYAYKNPRRTRRRRVRRRTVYRPKMVGSNVSLKRYASLGRNARVSCLPQNLKRMIATISSRFGRKVVISSGHRSRRRNNRVGGVRNSYHLTCKAVDLRVPGISKNRLARFVRSLPDRGGVGTYCGKNIVHLDVGPRRSWNYHCRGWRGRYAKK